jgi:hypothetical protein
MRNESNLGWDGHGRYAPPNNKMNLIADTKTLMHIYHSGRRVLPGVRRLG